MRGNKLGAKRMSNAVFAGVATILVMALAISIIFSLILKFTSLEEQSVRLFYLFSHLLHCLSEDLSREDETVQRDCLLEEPLVFLILFNVFAAIPRL